MKDKSIVEIDPCETFPSLRELPQPPAQLFMRGAVDTTDKKVLAVVGSRACTSYGKSVCMDLIAGLRGQPIIIVSGLAIGIDSIAHRAALDAGLATIALPGSSLEWNELYPSSNRQLAEDIIRHGGALIAEHAHTQGNARWIFPERNRLIAGIADMVLVIEAAHRSGTLITARLGTEYNKIVGAIPGPINAPLSSGTNWLLRQGAIPITESNDILRELGLEEQAAVESCLCTPEEERLLAILSEPQTRDAIIQTLSLTPSEAAITLSSLEIKGLIRETLGRIERTI